MAVLDLIPFCRPQPLPGAPGQSPLCRKQRPLTAPSFTTVPQNEGCAALLLALLFLQWSQTAVELTLGVAEEPPPASRVPIPQPRTATGEVLTWALRPSCHNHPFSNTPECPVTQM